MQRWAGPLCMSIRGAHAPQCKPAKPSDKKRSEREKRDLREARADARRAFSRAAETKVEHYLAKLETVEQEQRYLATQSEYLAQQAAEKELARQELVQYTKTITAEAEERRKLAKEDARQRELRAVERLKEQARAHSRPSTASNQPRPLSSLLPAWRRIGSSLLPNPAAGTYQGGGREDRTAVEQGKAGAAGEGHGEPHAKAARGGGAEARDPRTDCGNAR